MHRQRKKKKHTKDWPSKKQLISYRRKKKGQQVLVDYPAEIIATQETVLDEEGDLDVLDSSITIHTTDLSTARFNQVLDQHVEHLLRQPPASTTTVCDQCSLYERRCDSAFGLYFKS